MKNIKIIVQYDGTKYNGWQRQGNTKNTIQEKFENVLFKMCGGKTEIFASGRTDAGVHAQGQAANFKCETDMSTEEIRTYLNRYLPEDIRVIKAEEVGERFHARLNAVSKTYEYRIATDKPDVFTRKYVYHVEKVPDVENMRSASKFLLGTHDFIGFSSLKKTKKSTVRTITDITITERENVITLRFTGNGFLYNMVRILAGTLYEIGTGELKEAAIPLVLEEKRREEAGTTFPACGLHLMRVEYEKISL